MSSLNIVNVVNITQYTDYLIQNTLNILFLFLQPNHKVSKSIKILRHTSYKSGQINYQTPN